LKRVGFKADYEAVVVAGLANFFPITCVGVMRWDNR